MKHRGLLGGGVLRVIDIRPGEGGTFWRAFWVLLLTICGHTLLETARDALFLARLPPRLLTLVYVVVAAITVAIVPLSARLSHVAGPRNGLVISLLCTAYGAAWFGMRQETSTTVFALYVFGTVSATLLVSQFWTGAGALFSPTQGRRLLGPLAAGGVLGAVLGASVATTLLEIVPVRALLGAASFCYVVAAFVTSSLGVVESSDPARTEPRPATAGFSLLRRQPFILRLAAIAAISTSASVLIDYVYKARVSSAVPAAELGHFFARYQLFLNVGSLVLQVVLTGPLVQRLGVVGLALLTPALLSAGGAMATLFGTAFGAVVALKATDVALRNSLGRLSNELLWAPVDAHGPARQAVDAIVVRGSQAVAGIALLVVTSYLNPRLTVLSIGALVLALLWFSISMGLRAPYVELFRRALGRGTVGRDLSIAELDMTSVETLVEALSRPDPNEVIAAMDVLAERGRHRLIPALILYHHDEAVLLRALDWFGNSRRTDWLPLGERLLERDSPKVQQATIRAFALSGATASLESAAKSGSASSRGLATLYLAQLEGRSLSGDPLEWSLFAEDDPEHSRKRAFIEALTAHPTPETTTVLLSFARLPALRPAVTQALSQVGDVSSIPYLIERLKLADERWLARRGLVRLGAPALEALGQALESSSVPRRTRLHIPRSIAAFKDADAVRLLLAALVRSSEGFVRYKVLRGLQELALETTLVIDVAPILRELTRNSTEYLRLFALRFALERDRLVEGQTDVALVKELLDDKLRQSLDRIARLLQVLHRGDDIGAIFSALRSTDPRVRGRAVEFLDALIRHFGRSSDELALLLRLVVEDMPAGERARRAAPAVGAFESAQVALEHLSMDADALVRELSLPALQRSLQQDSSHVPLRLLLESPS